MLLLSDVLAHVNRFSQHIESLTKLSNANCALFPEFAVPFLSLSKKRIMLSRRLRGHNLIEGEDLHALITRFKSNVKTPFMSDLIADLNEALKINGPVLLAFDVFDVEEERKKKKKKENFTLKYH